MTTTTLMHDDTAERNMAAQQAQDKSTVRLPVGGYLFTPPENTADSFSHDDGKKGQEHAIVEWRKTVLPPIVRTPPASPEFSTLPSIASATGFPTEDSPLFPEQTQSDREQAQLPLFEKDRSPSQSPAPTETSANVQSFVDATQAATKPPRRVLFPDNLNITTGQDALRYYYARMDELRRARGFQLPTPRTSPYSQNLDKESSRQKESLTRVARVTKLQAAPRTVTKPKAPTATSPIKTSPPKRRTPKPRTMSDFVGSAFPPKEASTKHKRAPPTKQVGDENANWTELPDYAPPSDDLDTNPKSLKVAWHGHALPLTDDPDQSQLHEQEVQVASTLRLTCATYLTNKRKIFRARLQALREGKNFTKTAAQSACKIDVNKASQLWEAFDRVGWFHAEWYKQYL